MKCRHCDYALWNIRTRQCPECGNAFQPSDYEFIAGTVRFCCPHCDQAYYGTDERGHLVPDTFHCLACNQPVTMNEMVLRPAEGMGDHQTQHEDVPWVQRHSKGMLGAWLATVWWSLVQPQMVLGRREPVGATARSWGFAVVTAVACTVALVAPWLLLVALASMPMGGRGPGLLGMALFVGVSVAVLLALIVLYGALAHVLLRLTGPCQGGIGRTYQAICYSSGANMTTAVPCLGIYFGWIWWMISAMFMIKFGQNVSFVRAIAAAVVPPILSVLLLIGGYSLLMYNLVSSVRGAGYSSTNAAVAAVVMANVAQRHASRQNDFSFPHHAARLIDTAYANPMAFIVAESNTDPSATPIGMTTLEAVADNWNTRAASAQAAENVLPKNVIAHRLGDFVFCWHGITQLASDTSLWLFLISLDPDQNITTSVNGEIIVVKVDGTVEHIAVLEFQEKLEQQNQARAAQGLAPLPHPDTVTHTAPAVTDEEPSGP